MIKIEESTILELQDAMKKNEITSRELVLYYLSRIAEIDKCDGGLNSVLELNPDALFIADSLDEMRVNGTILGSLHGIPVMLKDNISTHDKMHTSAGSVALQDNYAPYDAHIVKLLREAGAVILGKTNMTEFANYMTDNMPCGYSSKGGQTLNPYNKNSTPGGSSSGSGVAVSANLCSVAVGTETCGSIIYPSQVNGIVGIKPTMGLLSRHGIIPISFTFDTPGPMTRTVTDAAVLLGVLAGKDGNDPATCKSKQVDYTQYLDKNGLDGARIGISRMFLENADEEKTAILESIIPVLQEHGADCVELPAHELTSGEKFGAIMTNEFKCGINNYLASMNNNKIPKNLLEIILYNQNNAREALKYGQSTLINCQNTTSGNLTEPEYLNAIVKREEIIRGFDGIFTDNKVDVIFFLAGTGLPAFTGFPSMTIPVGTTDEDNLPLGSFWAARRFDEKSLIRVTYALEQILNARRNPLS
jgi:amidase